MGGTINDASIPELATGARETAALIAASKVQGTSVFDGAGKQLGTIHDVILDKRRGQVSYAVMAFGGFLGIGEKYHPLPWALLRYDETLGGYVIDINQTVLEGAPSYTSFDDKAWAGGYGNDIDSYYAGDPVPI